MQATIVLKAGREKSVTRRHPWIFSGAIIKTTGRPGPGETVAAFSADGKFLAWAAYSPESQIRARVWSYDPGDVIGPDFFKREIAQSIERRKLVAPDESVTNAYRMINSESDNLPGLIVDKYGDTLVLQSLTAGSELHKDLFADILAEATGCRTIYERSDAETRGQEGMEPVTGILRGGPATEKVEIVENGLKFLVDIAGGHKTGFYLDQRENRRILREFAAGRDVLNCFCYTGGFSVNALAGGANRVVSVDSSEPALEFAAENVALNGYESGNCEWAREDVFQYLRGCVSRGAKFDLIVLDPPKFAASREHLIKAGRAYKDINMLAMKSLNPGGLLFTFSCSGAVGPEDFRKAVAWAALDAPAETRIIKILTQAPDHPVTLNFPQAEYLKGLVVQIF
ncbi:MAG: class I SAM-dependent rRNA methyltransferase [bacterium]